MKKLENIKEIRSIDIISFTLISSSTAAILAFIYAILILFLSGILFILPQFADFKDIISGLGMASLIILPIIAYFIVMAVSFFTILLYNGLSHRISGLKFDLDGNKIVKIPIKTFALIIALIDGIWALY